MYYILLLSTYEYSIDIFKVYTCRIAWLIFSNLEGVSGDRFRELREEEIGKFSFVSHVLTLI